MSDSALKRTRLFLLTLSGIALIPFLMNCLGHGTYFYLKSKERTLIFGMSGGACHLARQPATEISELSESQIDEALSYHFAEGSLYELIDSEAVSLFVEAGQGFPVRIIAFGLNRDPEYATLEFPWLLVPIVFFVIGMTMPTTLTFREI